jgi:hypothetical protein
MPAVDGVAQRIPSFLAGVTVQRYKMPQTTLVSLRAYAAKVQLLAASSWSALLLPDSTYSLNPGTPSVLYLQSSHQHKRPSAPHGLA